MIIPDIEHRVASDDTWTIIVRMVDNERERIATAINDRSGARYIGNCRDGWSFPTAPGSVRRTILDLLEWIEKHERGEK